MIQALRILRDRYDVVALVAIVLSIQFLPKHVPAGIYGLGIVSGSTLALHAIGIVLVYRSNRIINFAQVQMGAVAATFFAIMAKYQPVYRLVTKICPPCIERVTPGLYALNFWVSMVLALAGALGLSWAVYTFIIRRFDRAPRLILTVATLGVAELLGAIGGLLPKFLMTEDERRLSILGGPPKLPFRFALTWKPARFPAPDILTVIVTILALGALAAYFRFSSTGVAIRASAENPPRAETLGINVAGVTSRVWVFAGALSACAAILGAMTSGAGAAGSFSTSSLVRILGAAVIAGMASLPMAVGASVVFGVLDQGVLWSFRTITALDGLFVLIIGAVLMLQRHRVSRAELEQASAWRAAREIRPIPAELKDLPVIRRWTRILRVTGVLLLLGLPWILSPGQNNLAAVILIYMMVGLSLLVVTGWAGQIGLGQFAFAAIGGFVAAAWHLPFLIALVVGAIVGSLVAVVVGIPALKLRGLQLAIMTLAFALTTTSLLLNPLYLGKHLPATLNRPTFFGMRLDDQRVFYYFTLALLGLIVGAVVGMKRSRTARALIACRDNEQAGQSFGINLLRVRLMAFAVSGFISAFAGALFAFHQHGVRIAAYAPEVSITLFLFTVIGGLGSVSGPLIGMFFLGVMTVTNLGGVSQLFLSGAGVLLILLFIPGGLGQVVYSGRDAILRRVARRYRIIVPSLLADVRQDGLQRMRLPIAPKHRAGGGTAFVPSRYRLPDQWALAHHGAQDKTDG